MQLKKVILLLSLMIYGLSAFGQAWTIDDIVIKQTFDDLEPILHQDNDTTYLINFWATWCGPCVKELPYIEALAEKYSAKAYKSILVSLDMPKKVESKLLPFLNNNQIISDVILLEDGKAHKWIDRVDPSWSGAIPITIVYKGDQREFHEVEFHSQQEIEEIVLRFLK